jgi:hypothetical protein
LPLCRIQTQDFILGVSRRGGALGATSLGPGYRCKPMVVALQAPPPWLYTLSLTQNQPAKINDSEGIENNKFYSRLMIFHTVITSHGFTISKRFPSALHFY